MTIPDERPPLRTWKILALTFGTRSELVDLRIIRTVFVRNPGPRSRLRLVRKPEPSSEMSAEGWGALRPVLVAAGAVVEERPRTKSDQEPWLEPLEQETP